MSEINKEAVVAEEQEHLDKTIEIIKKQMDEKSELCDKGYDAAFELGKYHWENKHEMDEVERANSYYEIERNAKATNEQVNQLRKLRRVLQNPFFGRITINIDGEDEQYHIGLTSIMQDLDLYVSDWRSPIGAIYYNSRLGETQFKTPAGFISCNLEQRRQIKIKDGKVKRVISSDLHISDDELQEVLSQSSSNKMHNIVTTIQEEQNDIIWNVKDKHMIVQGCAGSGKTSVGLHRLAFLLFNDSKSKAENMLIFSPSDTFSSYISNVLPELGEDNVAQTTFSDFAHSFVFGFDKIDSYTEFVSRYYEGKNSKEENDLNRFKFTKEYQDALDSFIRRKSNAYRFKDDFSVSGLTVPQDYMNKIVDSVENLPLQDKIDAIADEVYLLQKVFVVKKSVIRNQVVKSLIKPAFNPRALYNEFLSSPEFVEAYGKPGNKLTKKRLDYPDLIGLMYLNFEMDGYLDNNIIHHLVVDEAQDYGPLQMKMIANMFRGATITVLGDANQTINPYFKYNSLEEMKEAIGSDCKYYELNKAYRSSKEIMEYTSDLIGDEKIEPVRVSNDISIEKRVVTKNDLYPQLVSDIIALREQGFKRICVITKSNKEAQAILVSLKPVFPELMIINENSEQESNTVISPSYIAKGLEFDAVINYNNLDNPYAPEDKYLYYVACTRAQHNLVIYNEPDVKKKELKPNGTK